MKTQKAVDTIADAINEILKQHKGSLVVALDGRSGTGKTTTAKALAEKLGDAVVVPGDDFYMGGSFEEWNARTPREKAENCIDWRRIRAEVLEPLLAGKKTSWHPFNWQTNEGLAEHTITAKPARVIILDVVYSARQELSDLVNFTVLLELPDAVRRARLKNRESGEFMKKWHKVWDEAEDYYFTSVQLPTAFDLVIDVDES